MIPVGLRTLLESVATKTGVPPVLALAIARVESDFNPYAWNPEPRYRFLWDVQSQRPFRAVTPAEIASEFPPADFPTLAGDRDQEWWGQQASWGLFQVMGAVAREHGFRGVYLPELTEPSVNALTGCRVLRALLNWSGGDIARAAAAYNAGRGGWRDAAGQAYAAKVIAAMAAIELEHG